MLQYQGKSQLAVKYSALFKKFDGDAQVVIPIDWSKAAEIYGSPTVIISISTFLVIFAIVIIMRSGAQRISILKDARAVEIAMPNGVGTFDAAEKNGFQAALEAMPDSRLAKKILPTVRGSEEIGERVYRFHELDLHYEQLASKGGDIESREIWPNLYVGIGLVLTFVGLALSLQNASTGATSGDLEVVKGSVSLLLKSSAAKFILSLFALGCSLVMTYFLRRDRSLVEAALRRLANDIDQRLPQITIGRIAAFVTSQSYRVSGATTFAREFWTNETSQRVVKSLEFVTSDTWMERLAANVANASWQHANAVKVTIAATETSSIEYREDLATRAATAMFAHDGAQIAQDHLETLSQTARDQKAQLERLASDLAIQLGDTLNDKFIPNLEPLLDGFIRRLEDAIKTIGGDIGTNNREALGSLIETFTNGLQEKVRQDADDLRGSFRQVAERFDEASAAMATRMSETFGSLGAAGNSFATTIASAGEAGQNWKRSVEDASRGLGETLSQATDGVSAVIERFAGSVGELNNVVGRATDGSTVFAKRLADETQELASTIEGTRVAFEEVKKASQPFEQTGNLIAASLSTLQQMQLDASEQLTRTQQSAADLARDSLVLGQSIEKNIAHLDESFDEKADRLTRAIEGVAEESEGIGQRFSSVLEGTLKSYEERFLGVDRELQQALETILLTFKNSYEELRKRVTEVDGAMEDSVKKLSSSNEKFADTVDNLAEVLEVARSQEPARTR